MRRVLVFQHVAVEPLGTLLPLLRSYGLRIRYVNFERERDAEPSVEGYDGLIVLGGPMSAWDDEHHPHLARETDAIRAALERNVPILGICLGAQLLARALGARVHAAARPEGTPSTDDIVALQLREAAERETDPELKAKLWEEYDRYKGNP